MSKLMPVKKIKPYERNAKLHPDWHVDQIAASITEFGFNDAVEVWQNEAGEYEIVAGHGRYLAAIQLGMDKIPCDIHDHLSDEQRRAYALVHNKLTMNTDFDMDILEEELANLNFDFIELGFEDVLLEDATLVDEVYTSETNIPHYDPTGEAVELSDLANEAKTKELIKAIDKSKVDDDIKDFLRLAAQRHTVFDYRKIAEYYAVAEPDVQRLMEQSALVLVDIDSAVRYGYVELSSRVQEILKGTA